MTSRFKTLRPRRLMLLFALLLLCGGLLATALAWGGVQSLTDDYGIIAVGQLATYECEEGEVWVPSPTNINGECVAQ